MTASIFGVSSLAWLCDKLAIFITGMTMWFDALEALIVSLSIACNDDARVGDSDCVRGADDMECDLDRECLFTLTGDVEEGDISRLRNRLKLCLGLGISSDSFVFSSKMGDSSSFILLREPFQRILDSSLLVLSSL